MSARIPRHGRREGQPSRLRILFTCHTWEAHLRPLKPWIDAFLAAGHDVRVAGPEHLRTVAEEYGVPFIAMSEDWSTDPEDADRIPHLLVEQGNDVFNEELFLGFTKSAQGFYEGIVGLAESGWAPEIILHDISEFGSRMAAERLGIPSIAMDNGLARLIVELFPLLKPVLDAIRADLGLAPEPENRPASFGTVLTPAHPGMLLGDLDINVVGHRHEDPVRPGARPPEWMVEAVAAGVMVVYQMLGRSGSDYPEWAEMFFESNVKAILATAGIPGIQALVSVGEANVERYADVAPPDIRVVGRAAQPEILKLVRLFIGHAGFGSLREAIEAGVAMLLLPNSTDQPANALRLAALGLAVAVDWHAATPEQIREKLGYLIEHLDEFQARVREMGALNHELPSLAEVRDAIAHDLSAGDLELTELQRLREVADAHPLPESLHAFGAAGTAEDRAMTDPAAIAAKLRGEFANETDYPTGASIPGRNELENRFQVRHATLDRVLEILERGGVIDLHAGQWPTVAARPWRPRGNGPGGASGGSGGPVPAPGDATGPGAGATPSVPGGPAVSVTRAAQPGSGSPGTAERGIGTPTVRVRPAEPEVNAPPPRAATPAREVEAPTPAPQAPAPTRQVDTPTPAPVKQAPAPTRQVDTPAPQTPAWPAPPQPAPQATTPAPQAPAPNTHTGTPAPQAPNWPTPTQNPSAHTSPTVPTPPHEPVRVRATSAPTQPATSTTQSTPSTPTTTTGPAWPQSAPNSTAWATPTSNPGPAAPTPAPSTPTAPEPTPGQWPHAGQYDPTPTTPETPTAPAAPTTPDRGKAPDRAAEPGTHLKPGSHRARGR